jgi:DNA-directed RNA polymerase specialized sigma24 family protein
MTASPAATSTAGEAEAEGCPQDTFGGRRLLSELLVASGRQDEAAFTRLYQLTSPFIYHLLRRRTRSTADAEDAMCLVYTTIWRQAANYAPPNQSALAWMSTLACHLMKSRPSPQLAAAHRRRSATTVRMPSTRSPSASP